MRNIYLYGMNTKICSVTYGMCKALTVDNDKDNDGKFYY